MSTLDEFVRRQILNRSEKRAPMPKPAQCMLVTRVAPGSVAAHAGIAAKDFLVQMDGEAAAKRVPDLYLYGSGKHSYVFYARSRHELLELHTSGIDLGIVVKPTADAIKATYDPKRPDYTALETLWEARDHAALESLAGATVRNGPRDSPALVYLGAALYEAARRDEALPLIREYQEQYSSHWTMNFTAIGFYYLGRLALDQGRHDEGLALLHTAFDYNAFDRIAQTLEKVTGNRPQPPAPAWVGKRFPLDYKLPLLESDERGTISLSGSLGAMPAGKLLIVCLLASYRANGPYNAFMTRYLGWGPHFGTFLHGLHVITEVAERPPNRDHYFRTEDKVRAAGLPFFLLHDADGELSGTILPHGSPFVLVLDGSTTVRYEGEMEGTDLWELLAKLTA